MSSAFSPSVVTRTPARWMLAGLSLVVLMPSLDTSIANAGLPLLAAAFHAPFHQAQWIVLSYLLAVTTLIVSAGRLGDLFGRRTLLLAAIAVFTVASAACAMSWSLWMLLVARAAQGLGAAAMLALAIALVGDTVPAGATGKAMGLLGSMSAIGTASGPSLGGLLMAGFGWPSIFLINLPVGLVAFELVRRHVPVDHRRTAAVARRFDLAGTVLLAGTLLAYALSATLRTESSGALNIGLMAASLLTGGVFFFVETRTKSPLIHLAVMRDPVVSSGLVMSSLVSTVMMTTLVVGPFYLSRVLRLDALAAGFVLSAGPVVTALTGVPAGRFVDRIGAQRMTVLGLMGIAAGAAALVVVPATFGIGGYVGPIAVMTASYASFQAANNTAIMSGAHVDQRGVIAGLVSLARNLGLITGAAFMGGVFAHALGSSDPLTATAGAIAAAMRITFAAAVAVIGVALFAASRRPSLVMNSASR